MTRLLLVCPLLALAALACGAPGETNPDAGQKVVDAGPPPEDQCQGDGDLGWLQGIIEPDVTGRDLAREAAGDCGLGCLNDDAPGECAIDCMIEKRSVVLSNGCAGCYGDIVLCTINKCLPQCIDDPQAEVCKGCQEAKGCQATFDTCTGPLDEE